MNTYAPDLSAQWERREPDQQKPKRKYYEDDLLDYFFSDTPDEDTDDFINQATQTEDVYEHTK